MFRSNTKLASLLAGLIFTAVVAVAVGCSGGSSGTGGQEVLGKVFDALTEAPVSGVAITVLETGESDNSGPGGDYQIKTNIPGESLEFLLETETFSATVVVSGLPPEVSTVVVDFFINQETNEAASNVISIQTGGGSSGCSGSSSSSGSGSSSGGNSNSGGGSNVNGNENSGGSGGGNQNSGENENAIENSNSNSNSSGSGGSGSGGEEENENSGGAENENSGGSNQNSGGSSGSGGGGNENSGGNSGSGGGNDDNDNDD